MPSDCSTRELGRVLADDEHMVGHAGQHLRAQIAEPAVAEDDDAIVAA